MCFLRVTLIWVPQTMVLARGCRARVSSTGLVASKEPAYSFPPIAAVRGQTALCRGDLMAVYRQASKLTSVLLLRTTTSTPLFSGLRWAIHIAAITYW